MGKTFDRLWPELTSFENLLAAYRAAAHGKRGKAAVAAFEWRLEENLLALQADLRTGTYAPGAYTNFPIREPKRRLISAAPFRDRVVHHALVRVIEPIFERRFIHDSYANRHGKGTHRALDRCTHWMRRRAYVLPIDVKQFFPSVDHAILEGILERTVVDSRVLDLVDRILASGRGVQRDEYDMVYFPGDDLLAADRPRGLPIGNLTSQFWANVYLNEVDQFVKRGLGCRGYLRYADDMLLFADDKHVLHEWCGAMIDRLAELRLTIHANRAQPRPCTVGLPYLGFQVFPDHRRLKRRNVVHARRRVKALQERYDAGEIDADDVKASVSGWVNHARYGDTWGLRTDVLGRLRLAHRPLAPRPPGPAESLADA